MRLIGTSASRNEKASAACCHMIREGHEPLTFERGLEGQARREAKQSLLFWSRDRGFDGRDRKVWMRHLPKGQFRVHI